MNPAPTESRTVLSLARYDNDFKLVSVISPFTFTEEENVVPAKLKAAYWPASLGVLGTSRLTAR